MRQDYGALTCVSSRVTVAWVTDGSGLFTAYDVVGGRREWSAKFGSSTFARFRAFL